MSMRFFLRLVPSMRHFTNHVPLQRQINKNSVKDNITPLITASNTNGKLSPRSFKPKKPSFLGVKEPPSIIHKTETKTWLEKLKYSFTIESNVKTREHLYVACSGISSISINFKF